MDTLFSQFEQDVFQENAPLAVRMRPRTLEEFVGQEEVVGEGSWLRGAIETDVLSSIILYGPAGTGKTTLAHIIASSSQAAFVEVSAVTGTVKDLRAAIKQAEDRLLTLGTRTILFIDEIHRFSRSQQDALLHAVENRVVVLIGATTENPYFEVNSALNSRSRILELKSLSDEDIKQVLTRALEDERGLNNKFTLSDETLAKIAQLSAGDARGALNTLELSSQVACVREKRDPHHLEDLAEPITITSDDVDEAVPRRGLAYDKDGDQHYDIISAFIKSMRGSDPDAAIYYLARMIDAGEDPKFIARRIFILASEDIGNADPQALLVASACFKACEVIGYPECRINLAQAAVYMALAPKSNASYMAINRALQDVRKGPQRAVPDYLRDRHRPGSEKYGEYKYPHSYPGGYVEQQYLPDGLNKGDFYQPSERGWEAYRVDATWRDHMDDDFLASEDS